MCDERRTSYIAISVGVQDKLGVRCWFGGLSKACMYGVGTVDLATEGPAL